MRDPGHTALGTWSGGRFMHFGEPLDDARLEALLRPGEGIDTVLTADVYGQGQADEVLGRALRGVPREDYCLVGAIGHDFYEGERDGPKGFPRFTDPRLRGPEGYADYVRMATERSLERCGAERFDLLLLHNPDSIGYASPDVWAALEAVREAGLTRLLGVAPGPANGFTLDLIDCFERFGGQIDWAMIILNPLEPWPGELVLPAAAEHDIRAHHAGRRLRRTVPRRRAARRRAAPRRSPRLPPAGLDRGGAREARAHAPDRRAPWADDAPARVPVEPRPGAGGLRGADAHPGAGRRREDDRGQARRACGDAVGDFGLKRRRRRHPEDRGQHRVDDAEGRRRRSRGPAGAGSLGDHARPGAGGPALGASIPGAI